MLFQLQNVAGLIPRKMVRKKAEVVTVGTTFTMIGKCLRKQTVKRQLGSVTTQSSIIPAKKTK